MKPKPPKTGVCNKCKKPREIYAKRLCRQCYRLLHPVKPTWGTCEKCKRERKPSYKILHTVQSRDALTGEVKGECRKHYMQRYRAEKKRLT